MKTDLFQSCGHCCVFQNLTELTHAQEYLTLTTATAKSLQSCLTLCDPINGSPSGSPVPGILQARTVEWVAISFSSAWKWNHSVVFNSSQPHGLQPTKLLHPWDFPGKSTGMGCHSWFQLHHPIHFLKYNIAYFVSDFLTQTHAHGDYKLLKGRLSDSCSLLYSPLLQQYLVLSGL